MKIRFMTFLTVALAICILLTVPVYAESKTLVFYRASSSLEFFDDDARCQTDILCSDKIESITAKVTLYYVNSNGGLSLSKVWSTETVSGNTYSFSEYAYNRTPGRTYVLEAVVTATDSDGVEETITLTDEAVC